jgi:uncharacterized membrane protein YGL010W
MKSLVDQLSNYADYHRSARNIATHLVGIPVIVLAVIALLSRPGFMVAGMALSPAVLVAAATLLYYLRLDIAMGLVMTVLFALGLWFGSYAAALDTASWLIFGVGGFVVGWLIQFIGHYFEGRKPAFMDDVMGLAIGPLFVVAEVLFKLGFFTGLQQQIEARSGPVRR